MRAILVTSVLVCFWLCTGRITSSSPAAPVDRVSGRIETRARPGTTPSTAVVYAEPLDGATPARGGSFTILQKNKAFLPRVLAVPAGAAIAFRNEDEIFHNVFSVTMPEPFDLGLYRSGAAKTQTFAKPAAYNVFCNIHPQMVAFVVIAPSPWVTTAAADGSWQLDLPSGRYKITAVSERAAPVSTEMRTAGAAAVSPAVTLDESTFSQTRHLDKYGKPYPASAYKGGGE